MWLFKIIVLFSMALLAGCSNYNENVLDILTIDVKAKDTYKIDFYNDITKKEFFLFDSKISLFEHLNNGNYYINESLTEDINSLISGDHFDDYYLALLNVTIGSGSTISVYQNENLIIYDLNTDKVITDGIIFKSIFNFVKKNGFNINDFSFNITNDYEK